MVTSLRRAFVAVVPPREALDAVARAVDGVRDGAPPALRWMGREQWHLTLRFLGDHCDLDEAATSLQRVAFSPIELQLGGVGAFARPQARSARSSERPRQHSIR